MKEAKREESNLGKKQGRKEEKGRGNISLKRLVRNER